MKKILLKLLFACTLFLSGALPQQGQSATNNKTINLIWTSDPQKLWEADWIREILSQSPFAINEVVDSKQTMVLENAVIVLLKPNRPGTNYYLNKFVKKGYKFGLIHLCDENYMDYIAYYSSAQFILRNYWHKKFLKDKNVHAMLLGYKRGFWENCSDKNLKDISHRKYIWSFAGQITKSTRAAMIAQMKKIPHHYVHETFQWDSPKALTVIDYRNLLLDSIFVPCPTGWWNLDSYRVSEALECGCIPIVEKTPLDYFGKFLGDHPFLSVKSWEEAPAMINALLADPQKLEERRLKCYTWWVEYKKTLQGKTAEMITKVFN